MSEKMLLKFKIVLLFFSQGEKTEGYIGVSETILATSAAGVFFGLFSGQPIMIIGYTGPVLLFEETLYKVRACKRGDSY